MFISGASLPAFVKLGKKKGYRLVGCQGYGFNAFFVRNDVGQDIFTEVPAERCFSHPFASWAHDKLLPMVKNLEWATSMTDRASHGSMPCLSADRKAAPITDFARLQVFGERPEARRLSRKPISDSGVTALSGMSGLPK